MYKGQAEIILKNVDGTETRTVEENMFTNAIDNIINLDKSYFMYQTADAYSEFLKAVTPIYKQLLGGVLLFENTIEENVNIILPPPDNKNIGYASNFASSVKTNNMLGSYNEYESGATETGNGYKHVWEFNTSQANGTTSCICLTSRLGGMCGWNSDTEPTYSTFLVPIFNMDSDFTKDVSLFTSRMILLSGGTMSRIINITESENTMDYIFAYFSSGYLLRICKVSYPKKIDLCNSYPKQITYETSIDITNFRYSIISALLLTPYENGKKICYGYTDTNSYIVTINTETSAISKVKLDYLIGIRISFPVLVFNEHYYALNANSLYKIKINDITSYEIISLPFACTTIDLINNKIIAFSSTFTGKSVILNPDNNSMEIISIVGNWNSYKFSQSPKNKLPILDAINCGHNSPAYIPMVISPYLATINNLTNPIVKNNTQTLKIIYTISEG